MPSSAEARVAAHCRRHGLLPAGAPVLAMVSGGADSTCLMHLLAELHDGPVGVLTADHGLRPEASAECDAVARAAEGLGLRIHRAELGLEPGPGVQERARDARLAAARAVAAAHGYARIATGHTASDQAETVLFRLARGTGRTGALGLAPRAGDLVRPLLALDAAEVRAWCAARGLDVVRDPSNADPAYARTRVREGLVPALDAVHPGAARHVAAFAERLRDEAALLEPLVDAAWERARAGEGLSVEALAAEPLPMRRLLARRLVAAAGLPGDALGAESLARVLAVAEGGAPAALPGDGRAAVEGGALVVSGPPEPAPADARLGVPGRASFGALAIRAWRGEGVAPRADRVAVSCDGELTVRGPRPGDRLPLRGGGHVAVGRLLAGAGVPARARAAVPVVACGERVVWVAGHRAAEDLLAAPGAPATLLGMEAV
ncbi:MAG: tRNA lysidine(34) synthetase TilS [Thermoleophilia bacterium]